MNYEDEMTDATPPNSVEAEQSVLGGLMMDNGTWADVSKKVNADDFYREDHRLIFKSIEGLAENKQPFDWITLSEWLKENGKLDDAGGQTYLGTIWKDTPSAANIMGYAEIVKERSISRQTLSIIADTNIAVRAKDGEKPLDIVSDAQQKLGDLVFNNRVIEATYKTSKQIAQGIKDAWEYQADNPNEAGKLLGISTGIEELDQLTQGYCEGDLIIVAGRPAMGKSSWEALASHTAATAGIHTFHANMEMPDTQIGMRMVSIMSGVPLSKIRNTAEMGETDWVLVSHKGLLPFSKLPYYVDDTASQTLESIRANAEKINEKLALTGEKLGLITVDYLQLILSSGKSSENRTQEVSKISRGLKTMAKDLKTPVMALSQLNRGVDARKDRRPLMSDLRESGGIEQDADLILFPYRDSVYNEDANPQDAEIIIAKQRNGDTATVHVGWNGATVKFYDKANEFYQE